MGGFSLEDFDKHIENLRAQLLFLNEGLDATDHNAPDWLATDLISLRNKSGRLQDDMKRFRDQLESEGLAEKKTKTSHKRLSLEGAKSLDAVHPARTPSSQAHAVSPLVDPGLTPRAKSAQSEPAYVVEHIDVTEEVNKRLRESRLQRLMETPSTAQKRKFENYEDMMAEDGADAEEDGNLRSSEYERTPVKRLRSSGTFEPTLKRKENGSTGGGGSDRLESRTDFKRRRL
ncbi:hypothetical protein P153DRAFT_388157 [Dothidotthia symphoricarpi CBS 119687]|uniref:Uncharacterized protein n=1 Tax=Dothidotthia symphoricarpi CBS 119687 TaxID=1392245 RepID=A0A6A6A5M0_9PLEO|nr:uncharacterized protein P153DRAFT_388157 [Dothidotthia symphoricarpi CBS 119687]KAF2126836.1 hypothetical protein P153DRAFT_388157 [Dothidotthia symphoricarpi CBS 119687]